MNIGIISINVHTKTLNFACPLHTYAFQQFLLDNNIESTVIDYMPSYYRKDYDPEHPLTFYMRHGYGKIFYETEPTGVPASELKKWVEKRNKKLFTLQKFSDLYHVWSVRYRKFQRFIDSHYIITSKAYSHKDLEVKDPGFDCYICATDVIWAFNKESGFDHGFFLASNSLKNAPKIGYAVSRGVYRGWNEEQIETFKEYISPYESISAREPSFADHIHELTGRDVPVVLDPVFLKGRDFWHNLAIPPKTEEKYVLLYAVMEKAADSARTAIALAKRKNLKLISLSAYESNASLPEDADCTILYNIGPEEWLGYIEHAEYIVTNSFHACAFSILFEKEFYVGSRHGDKVNTILKTFGLENRRFTAKNDCTLSSDRIDYKKVNDILKQRRQESSDFILNAIHSVQEKYDLSDPKVNKDDISIIYNSSKRCRSLICRPYMHRMKKIKMPTSVEYKSTDSYASDSVITLQRPFLYIRRHRFLGWYCQTEYKGFDKWYCTDGHFHTAPEILYHDDIDLYLFKDKETTDAFAHDRLLTGNQFLMRAVWQNKKNGKLIPDINRVLTDAAKKYMAK